MKMCVKNEFLLDSELEQKGFFAVVSQIKMNRRGKKSRFFTIELKRKVKTLADKNN